MGLRSEVSKVTQRVAELSGMDDMTIPLATDILHTKILHALFNGMNRDLFLVKGGVAMRLLTDSVRDTTDIDLATAPHSNISTIRSHMMNAISLALRSGLIEDAEVREQDIKHGGLSPKWHINGRLAGSESKIHLKIELSRRDLLPDMAISRFECQPRDEAGVAPYIVRTYSQMAMAASKVAALMDHKRNKTRDVYDLAILISCEVEPPIAMLAALGKEKIKDMLTRLSDKVLTLSYENFVSDVLTCLPPDVSCNLTRCDWEDMQLTVVDYVEGWLLSAQDIAENEVPRNDLKNQFDEIQSRLKPKF